MSVLHLLCAKRKMTAPEIRSQMDRVKSEESPKLRGKPFNQINPEFLKIVEKMLKRDPSKRGTAKAIFRQVRNWILKNTKFMKKRRKPVQKEINKKWNRTSHQIRKSTTKGTKRGSTQKYLKKHFSEKILKYSRLLKQNYSFFNLDIPKNRFILPEESWNSSLYRTTRTNKKHFFDSVNSNGIRSISLSTAKNNAVDFTIQTIKLT